MIAETGTAKLCKDCKHGANEGGSRYVCTKVQDIVTGHSPGCGTVRMDAKLCGLDGNWWTRRMSIGAIVDGVSRETNGQPLAVTPMATIRAQDDPSVISKITRPDDYKHAEWK